MKKINSKSLLRFTFYFGAAADSIIAAIWFAIACGCNIADPLTGYIGSGQDFKVAMYIAALFMTGWAVILIWGAQKPIERKGILMITAFFLTLSIVVEVLFWSNVMIGNRYLPGVIQRLFIVMLMSFSYFYDSRKNKSRKYG
ncbi:MAG: hypothetical protein V2A64_00255 [Candidatus Omnitrophota bacterium]